MKLTAQKVPYSSVVGQSVVLKNEHGVIVAQLSILLAGSKERQIQFADAIVAAFNAPQIRPLAWEETFIDRGDGQQEPSGYEADSGLGGYYTIEQYFGSDSYGWTVKFGQELVADKDDPDEAKAAAQRHWVFQVLRVIE